MATSRLRRRLIVLTVLGALIAGVTAYRRRQIARAQVEFHERYG